MPMAGKMISLVWSTSHEMADKLMTADAQTCSDAITEAFGHELGRLVPQGALSSFPLHPQFNAKLYKGRVIWQVMPPMPFTRLLGWDIIWPSQMRQYYWIFCNMRDAKG